VERLLKEALMEIAKRIGINKVNATGGKLYEQHIDIFNREKDKIYDARICLRCGTEFGFVKIMSKTNKGTIFHMDLDLLIRKDEHK
jgi:hypothetical protein